MAEYIDKEKLLQKLSRMIEYCENDNLLPALRRENGRKGVRSMKSVLISIKPKWCELIANGKKTIELRKTSPKLETPFKCYIYQTRKPVSFYYNERSGKVIGEFVCDRIFPIMVTYSDPAGKISLREFPFICLNDKQIIDYLGNGKKGYGWHISDLVIYDKPRELSEFRTICKYRNADGSCRYREIECDCVKFDFNPDWSVNFAECLNFMYRPPQSWHYAEEL